MSSIVALQLHGLVLGDPCTYVSETPCQDGLCEVEYAQTWPNIKEIKSRWRTESNRMEKTTLAQQSNGPVC
uniref:Uncharacterized protein n=1 Tax=Arundo donax TaxID=35708 RepID=A0A0A9BXJ2_ARUDO